MGDVIPVPVGEFAAAVWQMFHQQARDFEAKDNEKRAAASLSAIERWKNDRGWRTAAGIPLDPIPQPLLTAHWVANPDLTYSQHYGPDTVIPPFVDDTPKPTPGDVIGVEAGCLQYPNGRIMARPWDTVRLGKVVKIAGFTGIVDGWYIRGEIKGGSLFGPGGVFVVYDPAPPDLIPATK